jgi:predicted O-methyltransferase YrrM
MLKGFFKYYFKATTRYRLHSPFVYDFNRNVIEDQRHYYAFDDFKILRSQLSKNTTSIEILDFGAGSRKFNQSKRRIVDILNSSVSTEKQCQFLFRLSNYFRPKNILELGSSLGLSSIALALGNKSSNLITLEGSPEIAKIARDNFKLLNANNIELLEGPFSQNLETALQKLGTVDMAFIDGHHKKNPTIEYFEKILPFTHSESILIFDDIYWSEEMQVAWHTIKNHPSVSLSIDLFWCGIVFFKADIKEKQAYTLIPYKYKPWQIGLFK